MDLQWTFSVGNQNNLFILTCDIYYKWWPKFEFAGQLKEMINDVQNYKDYNRYNEEEEKIKKQDIFVNQEFKTPSLASLKKRFPNASPEEIKKKMLNALAAKLDLLDNDDYMSTFAKAPSVNLDKDDEEKNY